MRSARLAALAALAAGALAGCAPSAYDHTILVVTRSDGSAEVSSAAVSLIEGTVVQITATPMSADGQLGGDFTFDLGSNDTSVLGVEPALGQSPGLATFVFFGAGSGDTQVNVTVNGQSEAPIPATVTPQ